MSIADQAPQPTKAGTQEPLVASEHDRIRLSSFLAPKYWLAWLFLGWLKLTTWLPWAFAIRLHKAIGRGIWRLLPRRRRIVERNLELCFPELQPSEIRDLAKRNFENIGACMAEIAYAWLGSMEPLLPLFRIEGREHLDAALSKGKGVIVLSGHFSTLEICVPLLRSLVPFFAFMFSPRRNGLLNAAQIMGRRKAAHASFSNSDVRTMIRMLRKNAVVWYAPDQARSGNSGTLLDFFGEPAMTNTAASRLARASGATVVPLFFCRLPDESGYVLRFEAPLDNMPSADVNLDTMRLIKIIEGFIRECPEQYFWIHRRFKGRPDDLPMAYRNDAEPPDTA